MHEPSPDDSGIPESIQSAERWRRAGEELRRVAPEVFESFVQMVVMTKLRSDDERDDITKSYFLT